MVREEMGDNFFGVIDILVMNFDCVFYYFFMLMFFDFDDICSFVFCCWNVIIRIYYDIVRFLFYLCKLFFMMFFELEVID